MDDGLTPIYVIIGGAMLATLLIAGAASLGSSIRRRLDANEAKSKAKAKVKAAADEADREDRWKQAEKDLALSCVTVVNGLPCSGLGAPIRGTQDRYRCPVCGGQFVAARHGW
jgi:hypothetical protein